MEPFSKGQRPASPLQPAAFFRLSNSVTALAAPPGKHFSIFCTINVQAVFIFGKLPLIFRLRPMPATPRDDGDLLARPEPSRPRPNPSRGPSRLGHPNRSQACPNLSQGAGFFNQVPTTNYQVLSQISLTYNGFGVRSNSEIGHCRYSSKIPQAVTPPRISSPFSSAARGKIKSAGQKRVRHAISLQRNRVRG